MLKLFRKEVWEIFILAMFWGPSFLFSKIAVEDITPVTLAALRISIGAALLYVILKLKKISIPNDLRLWKHCFIFGVFANSLPFILFNYSLLTIPTSLSAIINGTTPVLTILLANLFLEDESITWQRGIGIIIGSSGFLVLFLPSLFGIPMEFNIKGIFLTFLASNCYAIAMVYAKRYLNNVPPLIVPLMQLSSSICYLLPLAFLLESPLESLQNASLPALASLLGLAVLGTTLAFSLYYRILVRQGPTALSMVTYLLPIVSTILGMVFLKEKIGLQFSIAAALILCGVLVVNKVPPLIPIRREQLE